MLTNPFSRRQPARWFFKESRGRIVVARVRKNEHEGRARSRDLSEAAERNAADGPFSTACKNLISAFRWGISAQVDSAETSAGAS